MKYTLSSYIMIIGCTEALFLTVVFFLKKDAPKLNRHISLTMLILGFSMFSRFLLLTGSKTSALYLSLIILPSMAFIGPLGLFITRSFVPENKESEKKSWHYILPVMLMLYYIIVFLKISVNGELLFSENRFHKDLRQTFILFNVVIGISWLYYLFFSFKQISKIKDKLESYYSDLSRLSFTWLKLILFFLVFILLSELINFSMIAYSYTDNITEIHRALIPSLVYIAGIFMIAYFALNHPDVFSYIERLQKKTENTFEENNYKSIKSSKKRISLAQKKKYLQQLNDFMQEEKPYLQESLTIRELAEMMDIPQHHLSMIINDDLSQNYYGFINSHRVNEAKKMLEPQAQPDEEKNILQIAYDSGFNSKSTFNHIFKIYTGLTPSEYRNKFTAHIDVLIKNH